MEEDKSKQALGTCRLCIEECACSEMVVPCGCKGSQRFIHFGCLTQWQNHLLGIRSFDIQRDLHAEHRFVEHSRSIGGADTDAPKAAVRDHQPGQKAALQDSPTSGNAQQGFKKKKLQVRWVMKSPPPVYYTEHAVSVASRCSVCRELFASPYRPQLMSEEDTHWVACVCGCIRYRRRQAKGRGRGLKVDIDIAGWKHYRDGRNW